jgi:pantoate--beta-alanine ligase
VKTVRTIAEVRDAVRAARARGAVVGLVPTMGALHDGHLSLVRRAAGECGEVIVSLFVNPTQFDEAADLDRYPRDEARDAAVAAQAGAHVLFAPPASEIYPDGFSTTVRIAGPITETLEGAHRGAAHFDGVATVVAKLFNIVQPDVAYFGQKDAQQAIVIRKLVADLDMPVRVEVCPTQREPDGLALSSRNVHLAPADRERAVALSRALAAAQDAVAAGERDAATVRARAVAEMQALEVVPEYLELVDPRTLVPITAINGEVLVAVAARVGDTRLIDNTVIATTDPLGRRS